MFVIAGINGQGAAYIGLRTGSFNGFQSTGHGLVAVAEFIAAVGEPFYKILYKFRLIKEGGDV